MRCRVTCALLALSAVVGCGENAERVPLATAPRFEVTAVTSASTLREQIAALFHDPARTSARAHLDRLSDHLHRGLTDGARREMFLLVQLTLIELRNGTLAGGESSETQRASTHFIGALFTLVGLAAPDIPSGALGPDGAAVVLGPEGGTVVNASQLAGVRIPTGALTEDVLVTIARRPDPPVAGQGPLATNLPQYGPFFDFNTFPATVFLEEALVGQCQYEAGPLAAPPAVHNRLQLAKGDTPETFQISPRRGPPVFLQCSSELSSASAYLESATTLARRGDLARLARLALGRATRWITPRPAFAAHGGLGGLISSFSPVGAVDPGGGTGTAPVIDAINFPPTAPGTPGATPGAVTFAAPDADIVLVSFRKIGGSACPVSSGFEMLAQLNLAARA